VHWLDRAYGSLVGRPRFFPGGWGDLGAFDRLAAALERRDPPVPIRPSIRGSDGEFESPYPGLPEESRIARFAFDRAPGRRAAVVVLAATGEQGYRRRRWWTDALVREGITCVLLENPRYGSRRPAGQTGTWIPTVGDAVAMGHAAVEEARSLLAWLREGYDAVAVTGFSMGGSMAAFAAASAPFPVAAVPCAAGHSASYVYCEGVMSQQIDWASLGEDGRARLRERFDRLGLEAFPRPQRPDAAILVGWKHDGYVAEESVRRLHVHWAGSELRWVDRGHVWAAIAGQTAMRDAVRDAIARL
jgi:alpha-beta hydrolase superfamily lysophospholipase